MGGRLSRLFGRETQNERLLREAGLTSSANAGQKAASGPAGADPAGAADPAAPGPALGAPVANLPPATDGAQRAYTSTLPLAERGGLQQWNPLATTVAPGLTGQAICFYALADGSVIVAEQEGDAPLDPLLDALVGKIELPYRAWAIPLGASVWSAAADPIAVVELPAVEADEFVVGVYDGNLVVDGKPVADDTPYEPVQALAAEQRLTDYAADVTRLENATFAAVFRRL